MEVKTLKRMVNKSLDMLETLVKTVNEMKDDKADEAAIDQHKVGAYIILLASQLLL